MVVTFGISNCTSSPKREDLTQMELFSNFKFLKDLSSDSKETSELKHVMDLSLEVKKLLSENKYDEAIALLESYIKDHPQDLNAKYQLSYLLYFTENYSRGLKLMPDILRQKEESFYTKSDTKYDLLYADLLIESSREEEAYVVLKDLLQSHPCSRGYVFLAKVYIKQHKYNAAGFVLKKAQDWYLSHETDEGRFKAGEDDFKAFNDSKILDLKSEIYFYQAYIDIYQGRFEDGKTNMEEVSLKYRHSPKVLYLYGLYFYSSNKYDESLRYIADLNRSNPSFRGYYLESKIYEKKRDLSSQVSSLVNSLKYSEDNRARLDLARIYANDPEKHYDAYILANEVRQLGTSSQRNEANQIISKLDNKE